MTLKLSLHQANKLRGQLITKFKSLRLNGSVASSITKQTIASKVIQDLEESKKDAMTNIQLYMDILEVESNLTKAIFNKNAESGVSDLLEEISLTKNKIKVFEKLKNDQKGKSTDIAELNIEKLQKDVDNSEDSYYSHNVVLSVGYEVEDVVELKKTLRKLENEINSLNISNSIEIEITDSVKEEFGF